MFLVFTDCWLRQCRSCRNNTYMSPFVYVSHGSSLWRPGVIEKLMGVDNVDNKIAHRNRKKTNFCDCNYSRYLNSIYIFEWKIVNFWISCCCNREMLNVKTVVGFTFLLSLRIYLQIKSTF